MQLNSSENNYRRKKRERERRKGKFNKMLTFRKSRCRISRRGRGRISM